MKLAGLFILLAITIASNNGFAKKQPVKEWTFMVFMNGHDGMLSPYTDMNLEQMAQVGSNDDINIVVQNASLNDSKTKRIYVEKNNISVVETMDRVDMGDYKKLIEFIHWTVENYPAKKYFINIWNHGTGWHTARGLPLPADISYDSISGNKITTEEVGLAMKDAAQLIGRKVDILGSDACLMAMIENASEVADYVQYYVGSQEVEPLDGWPYDKIFQKWTHNIKMSTGEVSKLIATEYLARYPGDEEATTFSALNLENLEELINQISNFKNELMNLSDLEKRDVYNAAVSTTAYDYSDYKDLYDFISKVEKKNMKINKSVLADLKDAFNSVVVLSVNTESKKGSHGLSIWLPTYDVHYSQNSERYEGLIFDQKTKWSEIFGFFF